MVDKAGDCCTVAGKRHIGFAEAAPLLLARLALQKFVSAASPQSNPSRLCCLPSSRMTATFTGAP